MYNTHTHLLCHIILVTTAIDRMTWVQKMASVSLLSAPKAAEDSLPVTAAGFVDSGGALDMCGAGRDGGADQGRGFRSTRVVATQY